MENVPGPQGAAGADGTNGSNGSNAWTTVTAPFAMPAEGGDVTVEVGDAAWTAIGEYLFLGDPAAAAKGTFKVVGKPDGTHLTLHNVADTAASEYLDNSPPGTAFPVTTVVTPAGQQGPAGVDGTGGAPLNGKYLIQSTPGTLTDAQDLSALTTGLMKVAGGTGVVTSVTLGIAASNVAPVDSGAALTAGQLVQAVAGGLKTDTAGATRTLLGLGTMATQNANAVAVTGGSISGITDLAVADGGTGASTAAAAQDNLGKLLPRYGLLGSLTAVDLNVATSDNAVTMRSGRYRLDKVTLEAASISLTTATAGVFTAAGGGGTTLAADQALAALTASTKFADLTLAAVAGTDVVTAGTLYLRVGTPQGAAATANVWLWGYRFD